MAPKQAEASLEKQITLLGNLRNAGTRAPEFREWRQATLTLIERIWPDQATRATRFRRIAFSVATATAEDRIQREAFERGCAEARRLLHLWLTEISVHGVRQEPEAPRLSEAVRAALVEQQVGEAPRPKPAAKARRKKEKLSEMLGFVETPAAGIVAPATAPKPPATTPATIAFTAKASSTTDDPLAASIGNALERAIMESLPAPETAATGTIPTPAPAKEGAPQQRHMVSYVARAFISMASELEDLGVPLGHRDRVRLALLDLAHHLDAGSVTWHLMRDAITLVMHYPALGRQAVPLLLPYLENAA
jgi:hypothetical protein